MAAANRCDIFVIGGGPAGATAARLLASWGWSVVLVHRPPTAPIGLAESLPASTRKLLAFLDLLDPVERHGFHPNTGNVSVWAGAPRQTHSEGDGFHVSRPVFDALLRSAAAASGARLVDGVVRGVQLGEPNRIEYVTKTDVVTCDADVILDCSGRAGVVARRGFRNADARYRTIAITAEWDCPDWPATEHTRTMIETCRDGWAWSAPLTATRRQCTVMIEPAAIGGRRRSGEPLALQSAYARELANAEAISSRLTRATQRSAPWACDASVYDAHRAADRGVLLVGDAASFIEPLSSAGVKKAMTSAWRAAVVSNTCLTTTAMAGAALEYYTQREREINAECRQRAGAFFAEAADWHPSPFWSSRAESAVPDAGNAAAAMRGAFDRLRAAPGFRLRPASALRFTTIPDVEGREVVLREAVVMPDDERPMRFAAGVNLPALVRLAAACEEVPELFSAYTARVGPVPMDGLLTGLSLLVARRALIHEDARS
jgi:flavin-dependent dehydrogenase